jgi:hypothetical protein
VELPEEAAIQEICLPVNPQPAGQWITPPSEEPMPKPAPTTPPPRSRRTAALVMAGLTVAAAIYLWNWWRSQPINSGANQGPAAGTEEMQENIPTDDNVEVLPPKGKEPHAESQAPAQPPATGLAKVPSAPALPLQRDHAPADAPAESVHLAPFIIPIEGESP